MDGIALRVVCEKKKNFRRALKQANTVIQIFVVREILIFFIAKVTCIVTQLNIFKASLKLQEFPSTNFIYKGIWQLVVHNAYIQDAFYCNGVTCDTEFIRLRNVHSIQKHLLFLSMLLVVLQQMKFVQIVNDFNQILGFWDERQNNLLSRVMTIVFLHNPVSTRVICLFLFL
eukprot:TRINITY_DN10510_c0_g1_i12.p1 TRINITY_DN10510_c0_g1~~TRINITY_DN10510_c0_g1_i12.p1  ORF type:complete len:172 (-),score=1.36 TRINITY_DN10510_c0_g1_i12:297-812(-)